MANEKSGFGGLTFSAEEFATIKSTTGSEGDETIETEETNEGEEEDGQEEAPTEEEGKEPEEQPENIEVEKKSAKPAKNKDEAAAVESKDEDLYFKPEVDTTATDFDWDAYATEAGLPERGQSAVLDHLKTVAKENASLKAEVEAVKAISKVDENISLRNALSAKDDESLVADYYGTVKGYTEAEITRKLSRLSEEALEDEATDIRVMLRKANDKDRADAQKWHQDQKVESATKKETFNKGVIDALRKIDSVNGVKLPKDTKEREQILSKAEKVFKSGSFQQMLENPEAIAQLFMANHLAPQIQSMLTTRIKTEEREKIIKTVGNPSKPSAQGVMRPASMQKKDNSKEALIKKWVKEPGGLHG